MPNPVRVEPIANNGFRATAGEPVPISAEGATPEEALRNLRAVMDKNGTQLEPVELSAADNPWLAAAGIYDANDPLIRDWKEAMEEYRREVEADPDRP
jgi:hypothetical protein